jgi:hypothetical protein
MREKFREYSLIHSFHIALHGIRKLGTKPRVVHGAARISDDIELPGEALLQGHEVERRENPQLREVTGGAEDYQGEIAFRLQHRNALYEEIALLLNCYIVCKRGMSSL